MSRIGKMPITIPDKVTINVGESNLVTVSGPKGELQTQLCTDLIIKVEDGTLTVDRPNNDYKIRGQHGLARTLIHNMVVGVTQGHHKTLEIQGVGYRVQAQGKGLLLNMGYSHPVEIPATDGISFELVQEDRTRLQQIKVSGIDKAVVGQIAADIRKVRKPDPYKGKGIRYSGEVIKLKAGKRAAAGKK